MIKTQGQRANSNGQSAEDTIASIVMAKRFIPQRHYALAAGIYGQAIEVDLYLDDVPTFPQGLAIEVKWQEQAGSVDEKFPYLVANIQECYPCPAIIVVGGGGMRSGAIRWLRSQVRGNLYGVYSLEEFLTWCNHNL